MADALVMDRFRPLERLGSGGMGTVYRAFDERLQREVALKEVPAPDPERVLREAQAAARLNHPGIVTLYELGQHEGSAVLVSELVEGETLDALQAAGELSEHDLGEIVLDLCEALAHAHARGVVHRDVKPQNVIVRADRATPQRAKLLDFGIARLHGAPSLTATGEVVGTLSYMSPEQAEGALAGPESDVYSLALTAYECLAGVNPVAGPTPAATARRIGTALPPLCTLRPDLPEGLADLLDACLDPDPALRPTAPELVRRLETELASLDPGRLLPLPEEEPEEREGGQPLALGRLAALVAGGVAITLAAGPLGAGGVALILCLLALPVLALGAPASATVAPLGPLLAAVGLGAAAPALGAVARRPLCAAVIGASAWAWIVAASVTLGAGPELPFADRAAPGWAGDAGSAADAVLGALAAPESVLAAATFAVASGLLAWILAARHAAVALLGAMLWAAALEGALGLVGGGALGGYPGIVVAAAAAAVGAEFGFARATQRLDRPQPHPSPEGDRAAATLA